MNSVPPIGTYDPKINENTHSCIFQKQLRKLEYTPKPSESSIKNNLITYQRKRDSLQFERDFARIMKQIKSYFYKKN